MHENTRLLINKYQVDSIVTSAMSQTKYRPLQLGMAKWMYLLENKLDGH